MTSHTTGTPIKLEIHDDRTLTIVWSDGHYQRLSPQALRLACPCARCHEARSADVTPTEQTGQLAQPVTPAASTAASLPGAAGDEIQPLSVTAMQPIGNYAYNIRFSDGHASGIFTFELLRHLGSTPAGDELHPEENPQR